MSPWFKKRGKKKKKTQPTPSFEVPFDTYPYLTQEVFFFPTCISKRLHGNGTRRDIFETNVGKQLEQIQFLGMHYEVQRRYVRVLYSSIREDWRGLSYMDATCVCVCVSVSVSRHAVSSVDTGFDGYVRKVVCIYICIHTNIFINICFYYERAYCM